ncbi:hypothetical protein HPB50_027064 [Hyalomma asiaticum]|uniref:Uncharacterized protein n=1 Tax=Hyalomma asiaticum TaxID=266040 RepID=A0ACB7RUD4_HYAAI|nr:hypothetical protein HPB50_027064 [Hyalomma asiaticum]
MPDRSPPRLERVVFVRRQFRRRQEPAAEGSTRAGVNPTAALLFHFASAHAYRTEVTNELINAPLPRMHAPTLRSTLAGAAQLRDLLYHTHSRGPSAVASQKREIVTRGGVFSRPLRFASSDADGYAPLGCKESSHSDGA